MFLNFMLIDITGPTSGLVGVHVPSICSLVVQPCKSPSHGSNLWLPWLGPVD